MSGLGTIAGLAARSLWNRRGSALLTVFSIAVSVTLLVGVERVRTEARASFANTISGTDLIVGARSGDLNLLLYAVFRIGNATNNITWQTYQELAARREVAWTIPLSLGDSHRGFRVLGTSTAYYDNYVSIVNTTASTKAVKVRVLEGKRSAEVLDFNLFLSPNDVWTGAIVRTADGAGMISVDKSCVVPNSLFAIKDPAAITSGSLNHFKNFVYA